MWSASHSGAKQKTNKKGKILLISRRRIIATSEVRDSTEPFVDSQRDRNANTENFLLAIPDP